MVLGPFMGSGTTGRVCDKLWRSFVGYNLEEQELNEISLIFSKLDKMWEKDFKEYNSVN